MSNVAEFQRILTPGIATNGTAEHLGRVFTVPWSEEGRIATVIGEGFRADTNLMTGQITGDPYCYVTIQFPDTGEIVEVPIEWMPPKGKP